MSNTPVTATVSEPVREKRPTLYGVLYPYEHHISRWWMSSLSRTPLNVEHYTPGSLAITIPGECDDATSAWRPASEVPDTERAILIQHFTDQIEYAKGYSRNGNYYAANGIGVSASQWTEIPPTPPGAKK